MVFVQWEIFHEFDKEVIDWQWVCLLFNRNQALCRVRDDYGMFPLHHACYWNAPLWAIQFFVRIWCEAMKEVVPISDTSTGVSGDWTPLELACDADAPLEMIHYLTQTTCHLSLDITNWAGSIVMERNRNIDVVRSFFGE